MSKFNRSNNQSKQNLKNFFYEGELSIGLIDINKDFSKRLKKVLRLKTNDEIAVFNGKDGLFKAIIADDSCQRLNISEQIKILDENIPQTTLIISMVKKSAMDNIFRQATECGITKITPVKSDFSVVDKLNYERIRTLLIEASEQCERLSVPEVTPIMNLKEAIEQNEKVFWGAEQIGGKWGENSEHKIDSSKYNYGLLIGPEGGFSKDEREWLYKQEKVTSVGLGRNILRADTAVTAICSLFFCK